MKTVGGNSTKGSGVDVGVLNGDKSKYDHGKPPFLACFSFRGKLK